MNRAHSSPIHLQIVAGLILTLCIISLSVVITLNFRPLYYLDIHYLHIPESSGYSIETIRENYDALIDYNLLWNKTPLQFPSLAMSESGQIHFEEVKQIFDLFGLTAVITTLLSALILIRKHSQQNKYYLLTAGLLCLLLPSILGILAMCCWDWLFVTFHKLTFNNDYWLFDAATDPVITILPDTFFLHCACMIFILILICSILCLLHYKRSKRKVFCNQRC